MVPEWAERAVVDPQGLEHDVGVVGGEDVGGGQPAQVLGGDRTGDLRRGGVEVRLEDRPGVVAVPGEEGRRIQAGYGGASAGQQVRDVGDLQVAVGAPPETPEVAADERAVRTSR
jgi:hypothetical protein